MQYVIVYGLIQFTIIMSVEKTYPHNGHVRWTCFKPLVVTCTECFFVGWFDSVLTVSTNIVWKQQGYSSFVESCWEEFTSHSFYEQPAVSTKKNYKMTLAHCSTTWTNHIFSLNVHAIVFLNLTTQFKSWNKICLEFMHILVPLQCLKVHVMPALTIFILLWLVMKTDWKEGCNCNKEQNGELHKVSNTYKPVYIV